MKQEFVDLINNNRGLIFKVCNLYCKQAEDRKDLFQEVVLQLWKSFPSFKGGSASSTWIYRVALNTAISNFRKTSKRPEQVAMTHYDFEIPTMCGTELAENTSILYEAINHLNEIEKAIIMLYLDEHSYQEIAAILDISKTNVSTRINRIKIKLEKLLNCKYNEFR